jgi:hypothetical protein
MSPRGDGAVRHEDNWLHMSVMPLSLKLAILLVFTVAQPAAGQVVRGTVRDSSTGRVIEGARIALLNQTGDMTASVLTGDDGAFRVSAPTPGVFVVVVLTIGYQPFETNPMILLPADTVEQDYLMQPLPFMLDPIVVKAEAYVRYLEETGFYQRQKMGFGHHVDPEWIERRQNPSTKVADLMSHLPGVSVNGRRVSLSCGSPRLFVDDVRIFGGRIDDWVEGWNVLAIEVYRRWTEAEVRYGSCAVVIWTRHKAERRMIR